MRTPKKDPGVVRRDVVVTDAGGARAPAALSVCGHCGGEAWVLYEIRGTFLHLQCAGCGTTYCAHDGPCTGGGPS